MQKFLNNFTSAFAASVKDMPGTGTPSSELDYGILRLSDGAAGVLTNPASGDYYLLTAYKRSGTAETNLEIIRVTAVDNSVVGECRVTVLRGQEGTQVQAYVSGDYVSLRFTRDSAANLTQTTDARLADDRVPKGTAGGVLSGSYPNPVFDVLMTPQSEFLDHANDVANPHATTKAQVGLGNAENTSDADKPVSTAQNAQFALKAPLAHVGGSGAAHAAVTTAVNGFMLAADKTKLDGVASGATANTGTVTAVTGTAPITSTGGTTPVLSMAAATASVPGYLTAANFVSFAGKQPAGTYATGTGTASGTNTGDQDLSGKQAVLVSGTNIKTVNGESILGVGNIVITGGSTTLDGTTAIYVSQVISYTITNYNVFSDYVVQVNGGSVSMAGDVITFNAPASAQTVTLTVTTDGAPVAFSLVVQAAGVATPTNASPANGATGQNGTVALASSAFAWLGLSDTHASSDWQLATDSAFTAIVQSAATDTANKVTWTVAGLVVSQTYYWRVRHRGASNGVSAWSTGTSFVTKATFGGLIGDAGQQGFGVGECPVPAWLATLALSALTGTSDKTHANYGNYQHANGGLANFIPKFFYKFGDTADSAYATYGANTLSIRGIETFSGEVAANVAGYALHRAFVDNGAEQPGFFIDKYLASKDGTTSCKSVKLGNPISLTTNASYNPSSTMTGCTGILSDAVVLARARGANWNSELIFQRDVLAKISLTHAQHATSTTHCAWYDSGLTTNFPKGCNNGSLADVNDSSVTFTAASGTSSTKPLTGSGSNLAKTTHNGQANGVADVNGAMFQALIGLTQAGTSGTDAAVNTTGTAFILKRAAKHSTLTAGHGTSTDAWGTTSSLATLFDSITGFLPWTSTQGTNYFGNGSNQVFSGATSGTDYLRSCCGIGALTGMSAAGTSQFGNDYNYQYGLANLFPLASGNWSDAGSAGVFCRRWFYSRSNVNVYVGFRASAYGN